MAGENNLTLLLRKMQPDLHGAPYGYAVTDAPVQGFARIVEAEGVTVIATLAELAAAGVTVTDPWARISLSVHSDLAAVGLTAAIAAALAEKAISANVVAGYYHDHVFVPWDSRHVALAALKGLGDV